MQEIICPTDQYIALGCSHENGAGTENEGTGDGGRETGNRATQPAALLAHCLRGPQCTPGGAALARDGGYGCVEWGAWCKRRNMVQKKKHGAEKKHAANCFAHQKKKIGTLPQALLFSIFNYATYSQNWQQSPFQARLTLNNLHSLIDTRTPSITNYHTGYIFTDSVIVSMYQVTTFAIVQIKSLTDFLETACPTTKTASRQSVQ